MEDSPEKCFICSSVFRKSVERKRVISLTTLEKAKRLKGDIVVGSVICSICHIKVNKINLYEEEADQSVEQLVESFTSSNTWGSSQTSSKADTSGSDPTFHVREIVSVNDEMIEMPFNRVLSTHRYCFICGSCQTNDIISVPFQARLQTFLKRRIFIPNGNRCCSEHLIKKRFFEDVLKQIQIFSTKSLISVSELSNFMTNMSISADKTLLDEVCDPSLCDYRLKTFTGLNWQNFTDLRDRITSMRNSTMRTVTQALVIFLFKMRTAESNVVIASIFGIPHEQRVSDMKNSALQAFRTDILDKSFGLKNISREHLIKNHTSTMAKKIHKNLCSLILICDGTYIRHEKSSNNEYQRKSFSGQKKTHLCKPFTVCTTDGTIIDMLGPFLANMNDATIMRLLLEENTDLRDLLRAGDILILDRGFRDVKSFLEEKGFVVLMPALKGKRDQLATAESNETRFITKLRWAVEAAHGIIKKKYHILDQKLDNKLLPDVGDYCRIACFLHNEYGAKLDSDIDLGDEIVSYMESRRLTSNTLAQDVNDKKWKRRKRDFTPVSSSEIKDFPELEKNDLKILFTGSYQLKQTVSYLAEIMDENNQLNMSYCRENENIIRVDVQSRHINREKYKCFIEYNPDGLSYKDIRRYCCSCPNGLRTVGCCAHVAAIVYYLSYARYQSRILRPAEILSRMFIKDGIAVTINEDSDEDDS